MIFLEVNGVFKEFGRLQVLKDISFTLRNGEILGLIGPNGTGKTTLVNLITGILPYSTGDMRFFGKSIKGLKPFQIGRLGISRTFQIVQPVSNMSTLENVTVGALFGRSGGIKTVREARWKAEEILDMFGLLAKKDLPAEGLNVAERKRLGLARSLAMCPKLLLLDEIMAGLNPSEIEEAVNLIKKIRDTGVTIILIEHIMRAISNVSDRILVLHNGEKIIEDIPEVVLNDKKVIEAYLGKRFRERFGLGQHPSGTNPGEITPPA